MTTARIAAAAAAALGLAVMARGAHLESRGRLDEARRWGRRGSFLACAGALSFAALSSTLLALVPAIASAAIALLGGLAGKPRPAWWVAAIAWVIAIAATLAS